MSKFDKVIPMYKNTIAIDDAFELVENEFHQARSKFRPPSSDMEAFAIFYEEVIELRKEVFMNDSNRDVSRIRKEAIQCMAMALSFLVEENSTKTLRLINGRKNEERNH